MTRVHFRRIAREYAVSIAFWIMLAPIVAWQEYRTATLEHLHVIYHQLLLVFCARYFAVALLTPPIFRVVERWPLQTRNWISVGAVYALGLAPFSIVFACIRWTLLPPYMEQTLSWGPRNLDTLWTLAYFTFADLLLIYIGIVVAAHAYTYFISAQRKEIERLELSTALAQSELQALRFQFQPHFLFNTLQGISTLVDTDGGTAQQMIVKLSTLLRAALKHTSGDLVPLQEELDFAESYLDLHKMRLGRRLDVRWHVQPGTLRALVPQLILQPLIENGLVHGIACCREGGWISIRCSTVDHLLTIEVQNSVGGQSVGGLGVGLQNTRARLRHLYASEAVLTTNIGADLATVKLDLPLLDGHFVHRLRTVSQARN